MYVRHLWQGNRQICGHTRCTYTVPAHPIHMSLSLISPGVFKPTTPQTHLLALTHRSLQHAVTDLYWGHAADGHGFRISSFA